MTFRTVASTTPNVLSKPSEQELSELSHRAKEWQIRALQLRLLSRGEAELRVSGSCMEPLLSNGGIVHIYRRSGVRPYSIGDIAVVNWSNTSLLVHRIVRIVGDYVICKGDNVPIADGCIHSSAILGIVDAVAEEGRFRSSGIPLVNRLIARLSLLEAWATVRVVGRVPSISRSLLSIVASGSRWGSRVLRTATLRLLKSKTMELKASLNT